MSANIYILRLKKTTQVNNLKKKIEGGHGRPQAYSFLGSKKKKN